METGLEKPNLSKPAGFRLMRNFTAETQRLGGASQRNKQNLGVPLRELCISAIKKHSRQSVLKYQPLAIVFQKSLFCLFLIFLLTLSAFAQELPDKIRGYKVYKEKILIRDDSAESRKNKDLYVEVKFENPELAEITALGLKLELGGEITVFGQSGTVDFILFKDFQVNGIAVEIAEYKESFEFKKNNPFKLEKPFEMFIGTTQTLRGAWREAKDSKEEWLVTGKIFVFGRFKKLGFGFRRVVPVEIKIKIPNPVKTK